MLGRGMGEDNEDSGDEDADGEAIEGEEWRAGEDVLLSTDGAGISVGEFA